MILQRYIGLNLAKGWLLVLLVLGAVFGLISFIGELGRTRFDYDALAVARYTLLTLPNQLVSLAPVIALLGSIVALANLDRFNELTIISCTGFPPRKLLALSPAHPAADGWPVAVHGIRHTTAAAVGGARATAAALSQ